MQELSDSWASAIYQGTVWHRRETKPANAFSYKVAMVYLDLLELDAVFKQHSLWSLNRPNVISFFEKDYHYRDSTQSLYNSIATTVENHIGVRPDGPIRILSNPRYWGYIINPITTYYCFDKHSNKLKTVVVEVTNTPWKNRIVYVLPIDEQCIQNGVHQLTFNKDMHVSPFQPMHLQYCWQGNEPGEELSIEIDVRENQTSVFRASLNLQRSPIDRKSMSNLIWCQPLMTTKVFLRIYFQAMKLLFKRAKVFQKPKDSRHGHKTTTSSPK